MAEVPAKKDVTLREARRRKETALAIRRELELAELQGTLLSAAEVERKWAEAIIRLRSAMLAVPVKCASRFPDPRAAESIIRGEVEAALKQLKV
jgi:hypothetical protein